MGGNESKDSSLDHGKWLNDEERQKAVSKFAMISHGQKSFTKEQFLHFTNHALDSFTSSRLFDLFLIPLHQQKHHHQHAQEVHQNGFVSHLGVILNGNVSEKAKIILHLASTSPSKVAATDLVTFVNKILQSYECLLHSHCVAYQSWMFVASKGSHDRLAVSLLASLLKSGQSPSKPLVVSNSAPEVDPQLFVTELEVEDWLSKCSFFREILEQAFIGIFQFYESQPGQMVFSPRVPQVRDTNWSRHTTILDFCTTLYINHGLPLNLQSTWRLLFSSSTYGASFSQLMKHIRNQGPTVIVVRDRSSYVFGGFASTAWDVNPKFQGNESCFLFQANPKYSIYTTTGYNRNFQYMNHHVQTLPNGVGMGGQFEYFGLWIDQSFDNGHSRAGLKGCSTYGSPQLSSRPDFEVDTIEVWAVGKPKKPDQDSDEEDGAKGQQEKKSILDKLATEDKAILDMVDRGTISDAIREEPVVRETAAHNTIISPF